MVIKNICILTNNVKRLYLFYSKILKMNIRPESLDYVEFKLGEVNLAIYNVERHNELTKKPTDVLTNTSSIIEIQVESVDEEYARLSKYDIKWCKLPTDQPWGTRSIYFYDPDGNIINFFSPIKKVQSNTKMQQQKNK